MFESPAVILALTGGRNVRFNLTEDPAYVYTVWKILTFECNFCNICWVLAVAMRVNSKIGHISNIMLVCNQFKEFSRIVNKFKKNFKYRLSPHPEQRTVGEIEARGGDPS